MSNFKMDLFEGFEKEINTVLHNMETERKQQECTTLNGLEYGEMWVKKYKTLSDTLVRLIDMRVFKNTRMDGNTYKYCKLLLKHIEEEIKSLDALSNELLLNKRYKEHRDLTITLSKLLSLYDNLQWSSQREGKINNYK